METFAETIAKAIACTNSETQTQHLTLHPHYVESKPSR